MAEIDDYPVDEDRVMRGHDDRIKPAVESAVMMGFDEDDATEAAKRIIVRFPGRGNVEELVVDELLSNSGGGARAFELPKSMPLKYAESAREREEASRFPGSRFARVRTANLSESPIDLTGSREREEPTSAKRRKTRDEGKGKATEIITITDEDDEDATAAAAAAATAAATATAAAADDDDRDRDRDRDPSVTAKPRARSPETTSDANQLLRQLAAERRARDVARGAAAAVPGRFAATPRCSAGGSSDHGNARDATASLTGAARRAAATAKALASSSFGGSGIVDALLKSSSDGTGRAGGGVPLKKLRVLTYNVWFAEHVALADRVQGLSDVVVENDPHVLCLQEVTPTILMLLHAMPWFEEYKCTPPPPTHQYFTLVLFKTHLRDPAGRSPRPVRREFANSRMGRYADGVTGIDCGDGIELTVMTSHLESFISKTQTSSAERVAQMKDILRVMDGVLDRRKRDREISNVPATGAGNALFAGDTNWDETTDGDVPLGDGWRDAWLLKGDGGPGYTYDLKRNQMMSGYLQKRLDRVFVKLESFQVESFSIVGTEPVRRRDGTAATHVNEWKGRSETKPVLPSDHFGVLVTLAVKETRS
jgi:tyrosyl-DNA phosphodiesterase 2